MGKSQSLHSTLDGFPTRPVYQKFPELPQLRSPAPDSWHLSSLLESANAISHAPVLDVFQMAEGRTPGELEVIQQPVEGQTARKS